MGVGSAEPAKVMRMTTAIVLALLTCACGESRPPAGAPAPSAAETGAAASPEPSSMDRTTSGSQETNAGSNRRSFLPPPTVDTAGWALAPPFYAAGVEPFWRLDADEGWFVFQRSGLAEIDAPIVAPRKDRGEDTFETRPLEIRVRSGACDLDGSNGDAFVSVVFEGVEFSGCGFAGRTSLSGPSVSAVDWSSELGASVGAVDSCLARLAEPAIIVSVYPREGNLTAVVVKSSSGRAYECGADANSGEVAFLDPIEPDALAPLGTTRFIRLPNAPAPDTCPDAAAVFEGDELLGYLLSPECRF